MMAFRRCKVGGVPIHEGVFVALAESIRRVVADHEAGIYTLAEAVYRLERLLAPDNIEQVVSVLPSELRLRFQESLRRWAEFSGNAEDILYLSSDCRRLPEGEVARANLLEAEARAEQDANQQWVSVMVPAIRAWAARQA